jgi:coenzyme A diphosphatase NUDT7
VELERLASLVKQRKPGLMDATGRYAVLVPLVRQADGFALLYEVRAYTLRRQPGEVCFPGGRMEPGESPAICALRETQEELAIPPSAVRVLGQLDFIAHRANFIMYPVLGVLENQALERVIKNPSEVADIFLVPVSHLLKTPPIEYSYKLIPEPGREFPYEQIGIPRDYRWQPGGENVPVYTWKNRTIWGLTGRITRHLIHLIGEIEQGIREKSD